jgi:CHAT domain-containing protein/tetratricopeptide (TPR) repeat protein
LKRYSMIRLGQETFSVHRLVQAVLRDGLDEASRQRWAELAVLAVERAFPEVSFSVWARCARLLPHALAAVSHAGESGSASAQVIRLLAQAGTYFHGRGQYPSAVPYHRHALDLRRRMLGEDHPDTAASLNSLGSLLLDQGDYPGARPYLELALAIRRKALGDEHPDTAQSLNNLGLLLRSMGDLQGALRYFEQALVIRSKVLGKEHPDTAGSLNNLGALLYALGDLRAARPYLEQALEIRHKTLGEDHPDTAQSLNNLGSLLQAMGDLATARPCLEQALAINRQALGEDHPDTVNSLNSLGALLYAMGELEAARLFLEKALAIFREVLGQDHACTATCLSNLGGLLQAMGDLPAARTCFEQALAIRRKTLGEEHPDTATSPNNLGWLYVACGRCGDAFSLMLQAASLDDRMIGQVFSIGSDRQRLLFLRQVQAKQECCLTLAWRYLSDSPEAIRLAFDLVLRRKALGAEALAAQRDAILGGRYPHLRQAFDQLSLLRQRIAQKRLAGPAPGESLDAHERTLQQWLQEQQERETTLARQIPEMDLRRRLGAADRRAVAAAMPEGSALVEFVRFRVFDFLAVPGRGEQQWQPSRYLAFVLLAGRPEQVQMIDLGEAEPIDQLIADFRATVYPWNRHRGIQVMPAPPAMPGGGEQLRLKVFDPLVWALDGRTRLLLSPDGDLTQLPFEVLPVEKHGAFLIDRYRISYVVTGRDVLRFGAPPSGQPGAPLVIADPDFDLGLPGTPAPAEPPEHRAVELDRGFHFDRLPGTRSEGEQIAQMLGVQPWLGKDALEGRFKQQCRSPRILHLATYGFFLQEGWGRLAGPLPENPLLRSWLILAGANTWLKHGQLPEEAEDGLLTAEDVIGLDLLDTELVVLSSCGTGLGQVHAGEGVFGFCRAFAVAGARTLVLSMWDVADDQTQELMVDFYSRILAGEGRAEALRQAQMALRVKHPDPYFWGAFICQGEPGPLG